MSWWLGARQAELAEPEAPPDGVRRRMAPGKRTLTMSLPAVQARSVGGRAMPADAREVASEGLGGASGALPYQERVQAAFGHHDVGGVRAHVGGEAERAAGLLGASAFAAGEAIGFSAAPDLFTVAHEAAHVIQQRHGVSGGEAYERHADRVAEAVVAGRSAVSFLDEIMGSGGPASDGLQLIKAEEAQVKARRRYRVAGFPVLIVGSEAKQAKVQYADGQTKEVDYGAIDDVAESKAGPKAWDDDWNRMRAPSPFKDGSAETKSFEQRRRLADELMAVNAERKGSSDPKICAEMARRSCELAELCLAERDFVQAMALYGHARSSLIAAQKSAPDKSRPAEIEAIEARLGQLEVLFLDDAIEEHPGADADELAATTAGHRAELVKLRASFSKARDVNRARHDDAFKSAESKDAPKFTQDVGVLARKLAGDVEAFLDALLGECIAEIGPEPCPYAMLALGSLAREDLTPYSDFEWAIVIDDEDFGAEGGVGLQNVAYFHTLARLMYLKMIALGETTLRMTGTPEFANNLDDITPNGMTFDGQADVAAKVPVTPMRQYRYVKTPPDVLNPTLTLPAEKGAQHVNDPAHDSLTNTKTLAMTLSNYRLIRGNRDVFARFAKASRAALAEKGPKGARHQVLGLKKLQECQEGWKLDESKLAEHAKGEGILVKKEIYRQIDILIDGLRLYYGLFDHTSPWDTVASLATVGDGWEKVAGEIGLAHAIAVDLRWKAGLSTGSGYGLLKPDADDGAQLERYIAAMKPVSAHLADFLSTH